MMDHGVRRAERTQTIVLFVLCCILESISVQCGSRTMSEISKMKTLVNGYIHIYFFVHPRVQKANFVHPDVQNFQRLFPSNNKN